LLVVCMLLFQSGCKTNNDDNEPAPALTTNIYVGGCATSTAGFMTPCCWKNETRSDLSCTVNKNGFARSVFVMASDVYTAGCTYTGVSDMGVPKYR
jgi:hypothetical protein